VTRFPLRSSHIKSVGYDNGVMELEFHNGKRYRYSDVAPNVYSLLTRAPSAGEFFHKFVKGKFKTDEVKEDNAG